MYLTRLEYEVYLKQRQEMRRRFGNFTQMNKNASTSFCKKGALSRCTIQTALDVGRSLLCMYGITFRHLGLCSCLYCMIAIYRVIKRQRTPGCQYCRAVLFLCDTQYCTTDFSQLIAFSIVSYLVKLVQNLSTQQRYSTSHVEKVVCCYV